MSSLSNLSNVRFYSFDLRCGLNISKWYESCEGGRILNIAVICSLTTDTTYGQEAGV